MLIKRDFKSRYLGSALGLVWAFVQPLVTILVMWFVFQYGFRAAPTSGGVPFTVWLVAGLIPWFFISEALMSGAHSVIEQSGIIKQVVFRISLLPLVKLSSAFIVHAVFIFILGILCVLYGVNPGLYILQLPYYVFATLMLLMGLGWLNSAVIVFFKDWGQMIAVVVQIGFWATPIFWNASILPEKMKFLLYLNPVHYLIRGYRDSFFDRHWFFEDPKMTLSFWCITFLFFFIGIFCFKRLKPHFMDVL